MAEVVKTVIFVPNIFSERFGIKTHSILVLIFLYFNLGIYDCNYITDHIFSMLTGNRQHTLSLRALERLGHIDPLDLGAHYEINDRRERDYERERVKIAERHDPYVISNDIHCDLAHYKAVEEDSQRDSDDEAHENEHDVLARNICAGLAAVKAHDLKCCDLPDSFSDINVI